MALAIAKETKLKVFICFTFIFFLLELISGYYSGSVALIADAFHMLSDVAALFIALYATKVFSLFLGQHSSHLLLLIPHSWRKTETLVLNSVLVFNVQKLWAP